MQDRSGTIHDRASSPFWISLGSEKAKTPRIARITQILSLWNPWRFDLEKKNTTISTISAKDFGCISDSVSPSSRLLALWLGPANIEPVIPTSEAICTHTVT
jgi:hypothetical protein